MSWRTHIDELKKNWIGTKVLYENKIYTIVDVDYNGVLHIDKPTEHNETTAVFTESEAIKYIFE